MSRIRPYAMTTLFVAAAFGVRLLFSPALGERSPLIAFTLAVLAAAARYGSGPALYATVLSAVLGIWAFIEPDYLFAPLPIDAWANVGAFLASSAGILLITENLRRSREETLQSLDALQGERERLRAVLESTTDSVFLLDRFWRFAYLYPRA